MQQEVAFSQQAFSIQDVCSISGLGRTSIYEEIKEGRLIARKAGRRTLILRSEVDAWLTALPVSTA